MPGYSNLYYALILQCFLEPYGCLLGPFGILQLLLCSYWHRWGRLVHAHTNKAPFPNAAPKTNNVNVTWYRLNFFIVQIFHLLQLDPCALEKQWRWRQRWRGPTFPPHATTYARGFSMTQSTRLKVWIAERTKMFKWTYGAMLTGNGWNLVNNHPLLNMMCISLASEEFLGAYEGCGL
jgi:hypothetical protein